MKIILSNWPRVPFRKKCLYVLAKSGVIAGMTFITFHLMLILFTVAASFLLQVVNPPFTALSIERAITKKYITTPRAFVPLKKIKPRIREMFIALEDSTFYSHDGISLDAMRMALYRNRMLGVPLFGGSTITQQITRTLFLNLQKSYMRKYMEVIMSLLLDAILSKDRILELYLNYIEWGKGVYGIGTASCYYYKKDLAYLNIEETIRLAVIITNPIKYDVHTYGRNIGMAHRYSVLVSRFMKA